MRRCVAALVFFLLSDGRAECILEPCCTVYKTAFGMLLQSQGNGAWVFNCHAATIGGCKADRRTPTEEARDFVYRSLCGDCGTHTLEALKQHLDAGDAAVVQADTI